MNTIPILNIRQFENHETLADFYSNDFSLHRVKNKSIIEVPHKHDFYLCVFFVEGEGIHEIDFNAYTIQPGTVFFLKPGQTHWWKFIKEPNGYIFFHTQDFYEFQFLDRKLAQFPFYYSYNNPPFLQLKPKEWNTIATKFKEINTEFYTNYTYRKQKIASLINIVYIDLTRFYTTVNTQQETSIPSTYLQFVQHLEADIEKYFKDQKSVKFYANQLNITPKHLNRIIKATLNKTTSELILDRVLLEAKRLIVHSNNNLASIAEDLGYYDYAYFSRIFKLKCGVSPKEFKNNYKTISSS